MSITKYNALELWGLTPRKICDKLNLLFNTWGLDVTTYADAVTFECTPASPMSDYNYRAVSFGNLGTFTSGTTVQSFSGGEVRAKLTAGTGANNCFIRFKVPYTFDGISHTLTDAEYNSSYVYLLFSNKSTLAEAFTGTWESYSQKYKVTIADGTTVASGSISTDSGSVSGRLDAFTTSAINQLTTSSTGYRNFSDMQGVTPLLTYLNTKAFTAYIEGVRTSSDNIYVEPFNELTTNNNQNRNTFSLLTNINRGTIKETVSYHKLPFPVFNCESVTDYESIYKYLSEGDDSGSVDPSDPINVDDVTVKDFTTNYDVYITRVDDTRNMIKIFAYNEDYNDNCGVLKGRYHLTSEYTHNGQTYAPESGAGRGTKPTVEFVAPRPTGESDELQMQFSYIADDTQCSPIVYVNLKKKPKNATGLTASACYFGISECTKTSLTDGYRFDNADTGAHVNVWFRAYTLDDLTDIYNDDYYKGISTENTASGTDSTFLVGNGFNTFNISSSEFDTINSALWSTDWTQVFKSNTVNPISCVISCKGIPFTADAGVLKDIIIANLDTGIDKNNVHPVKTFTVGTCSIPAVRGDFTDLKYIKTRCYLPFIGWIELPTEEVICRTGYSSQGIDAITKTLTFKYVVDFIDGNCRCIIAVNGTERWYYDGNCGIDIPLTSDNHTGAVSNSLKSVVATVASVGSIVGGIASENVGMVGAGVMGAINNAPNIAPTYNYSISHNPSGYIENSMNKHIMIILECPNVQIPNGYAKRFGRPCERNVSLGALSGFTKTRNANTSGINATAEEQSLIKSLLDDGVYL